MRSLVLLSCTVLLLGGCIATRKGIVREAPSWKVGETTRRQVIEAWGNPDFVMGEDWVWWNVESIGGKVRVAYMGLGVTTANSRRDMRECRLRFGKDGRLTSMELTETLPGGAKWALLPVD